MTSRTQIHRIGQRPGGGRQSRSGPAAGPDPAARADQVQRLFDAKAATWSAKYAPDGRLSGRLTELTTALRGHLPPGGRLLDLGCGTGELARAAAAAGMRVTACDIAAQMLRCAAASDPAGAVEWQALDPGWRTLPFGTAVFDAVVAASMLEYVGDPAAVLSECARVLRPSGIVLCTVPDPRNPVRWLERAVGVAARAPLAHVAARRWPRLDDYLTYLRISQQRHPAAWWQGVAALAGLHPVPVGTGANDQAPLRLLMFRRPARTGETS
jgi:SAM-dependent methyltransferase